MSRRTIGRTPGGSAPPARPAVARTQRSVIGSLAARARARSSTTSASGSTPSAVTGGHCSRSTRAASIRSGSEWRRRNGSGTVSRENHVTEPDLSRAQFGGRRIRLRRTRRLCAAALALAGCVGLWPQSAPSADLSTIRLPPGFTIDFFAKDLGNARFMTLDPRGTLLVSVPRSGRVIALPDDNGDGQADGTQTVVDGLELPHGLAFLDGQLYVAETGRV